MGIIIVGVSGDTSGHPAIGWAVRHAKATGGSVELVHIVDITWGVIPQDWAERALLAAEEALRGEADHARSVDSGVPVHPTVLIGSPTTTLAEYAAGAELLVVGTDAPRAGSELALSSRAARIAATATCPVAVIPNAPAGTGVVVGVDGSEASAAAVAFAAREADRVGDSLTAIYAWTLPEPWGASETSVWPTTPAEEDQRILAEAIAGLASEYPDLTVVSEVVGARPLRALYAASVGARMLVVGSHGRHGLSKALLGSVSEDMLLSMPCPVVVVPG